MMKVWYFVGSNGWRAVTRDETGANLPELHAPWNLLRVLNLDTLKRDEQEAMHAIQRDGYHLLRKEP